MPCLQVLSAGARRSSKTFSGLCSAVLMTLLLSCADLPVQRAVPHTEESKLATLYSIVFVIHGDGDYLYHDTSGNEFNADEEVLASAKKVAQDNPHAEVFIFHQRSRERFLFFFPLHDGEFLYYRNGQLVMNELYWRDQKRFNPEVEMYRRSSLSNRRERVNMFLYYGHEIPEFPGTDYDASSPDRVFTIHDLEVGLEGFTRDSSTFDLMVLSTCYGGTPFTIGCLGKFARHIIASPENLHLSYITLEPLEHLDRTLRDGDISAFAKRVAQRTFERLTTSIQTAVSVAVYDANRVQEYSRSVHSMYNSSLLSLQGELQATDLERCDCREIQEYVLPTMSSGVEVLYRPARFGRSKDKGKHSGWECWRQRDEQTTQQK